jgi:hypothetical protein
LGYLRLRVILTAIAEDAAMTSVEPDNMEYDACIEWTYPEEVENGRSDNVDQ